MTEKDIAKIRKFSRIVFPFDFTRKEDEIEKTEIQTQIIIEVLKKGDEGLRKLIISTLYLLDIAGFFKQGGEILSLDDTRMKKFITELSLSQRKILYNAFRILRFLSTSSFWDAFGNEKLGFRWNGEYDIPQIAWETPLNSKEAIEEGKRKIEGFTGIKWNIERIRFGKYIRGDLRVVSDVIIVGSGMSAGYLAELLSRLDISVSILEKGYFVSGELPSVFLAQTTNQLGIIPVLSSANMNLISGRGVGGLTNMYFSLLHRLPDQAKENWRKFHGINTKEIMYDYAEQEAEKIINSRADGKDEQESKTIKDIGEIVGTEQKFFTKLIGRKSNPISGDKALSSELFIKYAVHFGANLYLGFEVEKISRSSRKWFVEGKIKDEFGNVKGTFIAESKALFLCSGSYGNTKILMNSGFKENMLGRKLKLNPAGFIIAYYKSAQNQFNSPNYIEFNNGIMVKEVKFAPSIWSGFITESGGEDLVKKTKQYPFTKTLMFWFREDGNSYFVRTPFGIFPKANFNGEDIAKFLFAVRELSLALLATGARLVIPPVRGIPTFEKPDDVDDSNIEKVKPSQLEMFSLFATGGCPASFSSQNGIVDSSGRVFGENSLFICDGSALPDSTLTPPILPAVSLTQICAYAFMERKKFIM